MESHLFNVVLYAVLVAAIFALFMREGTRERLRFAAMLALSMIGIAIAAAWVMGLAR